MENIISLMKKYNFTEYETKVYIALLQTGNATGYEVSKLSSVPRSKVYNTLADLSKKGLVLSSQGDQVLYSAVPVDEFVNSLKRDVKSDMDALKLSLNQYRHTNEEKREIWNIEGYDNVINKAKSLLSRAESELFVQIWKEDIDDEMLSLLQDAQNRIDKFIVILFSQSGNYTIDLKRCYPHHFEEEKLHETKSRWMNIVINSDEMLMSSVYNHTMANAITTKNEPMVFLSREYIVHDAYTARILRDLDEKSREFFGPDLKKVRDVFI